MSIQQINTEEAEHLYEHLSIALYNLCAVVTADKIETILNPLIKKVITENINYKEASRINNIYKRQYNKTLEYIWPDEFEQEQADRAGKLHRLKEKFKYIAKEALESGFEISQITDQEISPY